MSSEQYNVLLVSTIKILTCVELIVRLLRENCGNRIPDCAQDASFGRLYDEAIINRAHEREEKNDLSIFIAFKLSENYFKICFLPQKFLTRRNLRIIAIRNDVQMMQMICFCTRLTWASNQTAKASPSWSDNTMVIVVCDKKVSITIDYNPNRKMQHMWFWTNRTLVGNDMIPYGFHIALDENFGRS